MNLADQLAESGFAVVPNVLGSEQVDRLLAGLARAAAGDAVRVRGREAYAMRNVLDLVPEAREAAACPEVRRMVEAVLGPDAAPVKATLFDKTRDANWYVGWHQDVTIAVRERLEVEGFTSWSVKAGVPHVQPPAEVLAGMLSVRLHLDPCGPENGALRVIPRSHGRGRLSSAEVEASIARREAVSCIVPCGGALLLRPLLLHASSPALAPEHRRVLHLEFAAEPLPSGLEWYRPLDGGPS